MTEETQEPTPEQAKAIVKAACEKDAQDHLDQLI